ncbi:helix-turn-helix domain-containing protein [Sinomicrobium weinanense]|uniref:Helix-turn-helix transcriptional regulator n=1 Tax=Sinomicrobium weinanense TaxID=2842200 RepID=A0A926JQK2_9FLAO|nr:AraC family transcriptional regulator [Sinomicrobium weinanense]MBC9795662.1 helix-turn-helix transcriptional regulator [Sinomicrobium weinanense]MBU3122831.1 AraC family transcriptional regulator [Sinomicrobium weinanense]
MKKILPTEKFHTLKPKQLSLHKYIAYYYFHSIPEKGLQRKIVFYPNYLLALTVYQASMLKFDQNTATSQPVNSDYFHHYYGGIRREFRGSIMNSPFEKIGIVFQPLGLQYFSDVPIGPFIPRGTDLSFSYFRKKMQGTLKKVFKTGDLNAKVGFLDDFFTSQLCVFDNKLLINSVELIINTEQNKKVKEVAESMKTSSKTLNREFKKHMNCTVKDYLEVVQFRKAFNHYLSGNGEKNLTELAMEFDYYDQSEFINKFRKLTGINPKKLFSSVENFGGEKLYWNTL